MPSLRRYGWHPLPAHLAFAVLGWAMLSPAPARAGCGDYVRVLNAGAPAGRHDPGNSNPAAPCHGPSCDRPAPLAPPAPPAPPPAPQTQLDAVLPPVAPADPPRPTAAAVESDPRPPALSAGIFRPPRA